MNAKLKPNTFRGAAMAKQVFDTSTGEVVREPDFVKVYIKDLCAINGIRGVQYSIFNFMLENMNYHNEVSFGKSTKERFLTKHQIKNQTFNNYVGNLISANLIERIGRNEFRVNKKYAVKVDWSKVQSIKWKTEYAADGKRETVEFKGISE